MTEQTTTPASEIFEQALPGIQAGDLSDLLERCADDIVFEFPFAPADRPGRVEGRDAVREYLGPIFARTQTQGLSSLTIHHTVDPAVAVIEFTATVQIGGGPVVPVAPVTSTRVDGAFELRSALMTGSPRGSSRGWSQRVLRCSPPAAEARRRRERPGCGLTGTIRPATLLCSPAWTGCICSSRRSPTLSRSW
jgi:ketosteroid isomerase-like protein